MASLEPRITLSLLWLYLMLNFIYCDIISLHDPSVQADVASGQVGDIVIDDGFLLSASVLMTIPISMVLLSRLLPVVASRLASIGAAAVMIAVQSASLFVGTVAPNYAYFSAIEIATMIVIIAVAVRSRRPASIAVQTAAA